jgi:hypothetical protein
MGSERILVVLHADDVLHLATTYAGLPLGDACRAALVRKDGEAWEGWQTTDGKPETVYGSEVAARMAMDYRGTPCPVLVVPRPEGA